MKTKIKCEQILDFLPSHLKENDYFVKMFMDFTSNISTVVMREINGNYLFLTPFNSREENAHPFVLSFTENGNLKMIVEKDIDNGDLEDENLIRVKETVSVDERDNILTIKKYSIKANIDVDYYKTTKSQSMESRIYDKNGVLRESSVKKDVSREMPLDDEFSSEWNELESTVQYELRTYVSPTEAYVAYSDNTISGEKYFYVVFNNEDIEYKTEIEEDVYQSVWQKEYDNLYGIHDKELPKVKTKKEIRIN